MRNRLDGELEQLRAEMTKMGGLCEAALLCTVEDLLKGNAGAYEHIALFAETISRKEREMENFCLKLLLHHQPVAKDLRMISAVLKVVADLDRIGMQTADIAEIIGFLDGRPAGENGLIGQEMMETMKMLTRSVDACVRQDLLLAEQVIAYDDVVDDLFTQVRQQLLERIVRSPQEGKYTLDLLMIAKYFERIADYAVDIAKWVIFSGTGIYKEGGREVMMRRRAVR